MPANTAAVWLPNYSLIFYKIIPKIHHPVRCISPGVRFSAPFFYCSTIFCGHYRPVLNTLMNNDQYNQYKEIDGKLYRYDPDFDAYYRVYNESTVSKWIWIPVTLVLAAICYYIEFLR